ncbi:MAG: hypothetical protein ABSH39_24055 [Candidatus Acidiferrum sp.]|jgi:hypothetical protein
MKKSRIAILVFVFVVLCAIVIFGFERWGTSNRNPREELLAQLPAEANTVLGIDLDAMRQSPFAAELYKWAPQTKADPDYAQFVQATAFNYESDLSRVYIAILKRGQSTALFAVADGRFDKKKISAYASQTGTRENRAGKEIFSVPMSGDSRRITFTFLRKDRIALTNNVSLLTLTPQTYNDSDARAWRERFRRLAGSPVFAVVRQDAGAGAELSARTPGGLQSPQLSALVDQLQWITVAGKPEGDHLRVVVEGEGATDASTRQLSDLLNGLLMLAQAGLNDPKLRQQLQPQVREAYLEMLKSADVSEIDRGDTKSVRLIFDVTPNFLEAARQGAPAAPQVPQGPGKILKKKATILN